MLSSSRMPRPSFTSSIGRGDAHSTCSGLPCLPSSPTVGFTTQLGPPIVATSGRSARHSAKPFTAGGAARHSAVLGLAPLSGPGEGEQHPASAARRLDIGGPVPSAPLVLAPVCPPDGAPPTPHPMILEFSSFNIGTTAMCATMRCGAPCLRPAQSPKWVMTVTGSGGAPLAVPTHSAAAGSLIAAPMIGTRRRDGSMAPPIDKYRFEARENVPSMARATPGACRPSSLRLSRPRLPSPAVDPTHTARAAMGQQEARWQYQ